QKLIDHGIIVLQEEVNEVYRPKMVRYIRIAPDFADSEALSALLSELKGAKQKELLLAYFQLKAAKKPITAKQLLEASGSSAATLKGLIDRGIFEDYHLQHDRVDFGENLENKNFELNSSQQNAFKSIQEIFENKDVCLLHGVTASGKTEIYIRLIEQYLESEKQVLYLLPEIALTTQLVGRLTAYFGNKVAVFHSKYNNNERIEVWNQVLASSPKAQVVIGARSALFLPFRDLGLIIIDEEHEQTFKQ